MTQLIHKQTLLDTATTTEEIISAWDKIGFLEGLSGEVKDKVAVSMHKARELLFSNSKGVSDDLEAVIFPIIRKVITGFSKEKYSEELLANFSIENLFNEAVQHLPKFFEAYRALFENDNRVGDWEAQSCTSFSNAIVYKLSIAIRRKEYENRI